MEKAKLVTRTGEFVSDVFVLPMTPPAEILGWGSRMFVLDNEAEELTYREGIMVIGFTDPGKGDSNARQDLGTDNPR